MKPGKELLFLALGGSGEIGMNVNLYGCDGKWLMVDCGITFADPTLPGVDVILPDLSFIEDRIDDLVGIVLTHGHEDHIGALPYLAQDLGVPLYAAPFTAGLIREKLEGEGIADKVKLKMVEPNRPYKLGPFTINHIPMAHSIPEGNALVIDTPYGRVFHSGDWKLDIDPVLGTPSTAKELEAIGDKGVLALMCDSTNVFNETASGSESAVREGLDDVIGAAEGRVLVTTFASNAARLHTLGQVAEDTGRKLVVAGRSLDRIIKVARAAGYLKDFPETVDFDRAMKLPAREVMIIATGGQGEARAALARIASGSHQLKLGKGDLVVFSSKQIPGNETAIGRIQNQLAGAGVQMITDRQAHVHVSGHPGQPELELMYKWIRPEILVPVHGELRHLTEHARFAMEKGIRRAVVQENGSLIRLAPGAPSLVSHEATGRLVIDGDVILPSDGSTMQERRRVAAYGQVSVAAAIDKRGKLAGDPQIRTQGLPVEEDRDDFIAEAVAAVEEALGSGAKGEKRQEAVRLAVRRTAVRWTGKKPVVDVMLLAV